MGISVSNSIKKLLGLALSKPTTTGSLDLANNVGGESGIRFSSTGGNLSDDGEVHGFSRNGTPLWMCDNDGVFLSNDMGIGSDERLKKNWQVPPEDFIEQLALVLHGSYDRTDVNISQVGASAQGIASVPGLANAVRERPDGYLTLAYGNAALVAAIQLAIRSVEDRKKIKELTERIEALEKNK